MRRGQLSAPVQARGRSVQAIGSRGVETAFGAQVGDASLNGTSNRSGSHNVQHGNAPIDSNRNEVRSSRGRGGVMQRITRGVKRRKRYQGTALRFSADDYDETEGRPPLDENGIRDPEGSRRTKKLVVTRDDNLRLRSVSPQTDDDMSTDDSEEDPRCVEANDPTVRIRT